MAAAESAPGRPVVVITGGSRGIGAATARLAVAEGFDVVISYRRDGAAARAVEADVTAAGARCLSVQADVAEEADVLALFAAIDARFGRLDALVNNAGIAATQQRVEDYSAERLQRLFAVNITGSFLCAREAVKRLSTARGGRGGSIVNLSSAASRLGSPNEFVDYAASKGAIDSMTLGLAREVAAAGIRVNAVRPGLIETDIHAAIGEPDRVANRAAAIPMQRGGSAAEVAATILWLMSDAASYVTGALVDVAGGR